jgi:hypothetical protein
MESKLPKEDISDTMSNGSTNEEASTTSEVEYTEEELKKAEEFKEKGNLLVTRMSCSLMCREQI